MVLATVGPARALPGTSRTAVRVRQMCGGRAAHRDAQGRGILPYSNPVRGGSANPMSPIALPEDHGQERNIRLNHIVTVSTRLSTPSSIRKEAE
ncbi:hypothetical protein GCM10010387_31280 [Streptomyces inusitatus]|uniref:Uncharacterized protein n=1 Tax=Streptomyces inusitatus TaxID=68221 RepID=A0A918Q6J6_9ACTN|nr:hypothetical protein GCM10010387_31280 [Streptomyces inusitatus]